MKEEVKKTTVNIPKRLHLRKKALPDYIGWIHIIDAGMIKMEEVYGRCGAQQNLSGEEDGQDD